MRYTHTSCKSLICFLLLNKPILIWRDIDIIMSTEGEYEIIPSEPLRKLENEIEELREYIKKIASTNTHNYPSHRISSGVEVISAHKKEPMRSNVDITYEILNYVKMNQELIGSIIRTNVELQSRLSEAIVSINEMTKEIRKLIDIFRDAAVEYLREDVNKSKEENSEEKKKKEEELRLLQEKLESIERLNSRMIEVLDKLHKSIENMSKVSSNVSKEPVVSSSKTEEKPLPKPPMLPPMPPPPAPPKAFKKK